MNNSSEQKRLVRVCFAVACSAVARGSSTPERYAHAATYFSLALTALMQLSSVLTTFLKHDGDNFYTSERNASFDLCMCINVHEGTDGTSALPDNVLTAPPSVFWKVFVAKVLLLYKATLKLQDTATAPMARRLVRFVRESGATGVIISVVRAQLLAIAGLPEHGTVATYEASDHAASARPDIYAATSADVWNAAKVRHVPLADIQHTQMFSGPVLLLCDEARFRLSEVLSEITGTAGPYISAVVLEAADAAGSRAIFSPENDKAIIDAGHVHWLLTLLALSQTLDGLRQHVDPEYLREELLSEP